MKKPKEFNMDFAEELFGRRCGRDIQVRTYNMIKRYDLVNLILTTDDRDALIEALCAYKGMGRVTITDILDYKREFQRSTE